jgi:hypothetical protein
MARVKQGKVVFAAPEADACSRNDLEKLRKIPSEQMCCSSTEERTWVELKEKMVREFVVATAGRNEVDDEVTATKKSKKLKKSGHHREEEEPGVLKLKAKAFMFRG